MNERQSRLDPAVVEVEEELRQLTGGEHALVDERAARQRREVDATVGEAAELVLDALAHDEGPALEGVVGQAVAGEEGLAEQRLDALGHRADHGVVVGDVAPAEDPQALAAGDLLDRQGGFVGLVRVVREERDAGGVVALLRQREVDDVTEEAVGDLQQDARTVAGVGLGPGRATVVEVAEGSDAVLDDLVAPQALHVHDEVDAAGVVLEPRVVEALGRGRASGARLRHASSYTGEADAHRGRPIEYRTDRTDRLHTGVRPRSRGRRWPRRGVAETTRMGPVPAIPEPGSRPARDRR